MEVSVFKDMIVPIIGGLGIFLLGLEFMSNGIQSLAVNKMRALLARFAGTPVKGVLAGTVITGVLQSSTAMTVMTVGLVNAGVIALRPAISVIMGANVGTTLGNGLIALPLGPLGLLLAGVSALIYVFGKSERVRNIALACMGFGLIFYGLNLMTGGLKPLRSMPEVMGLISSLRADGFVGLLSCVLIAACITALIHSSSATIGIVMGLGAAGVLDWQTAVAFSLGADLGTTVTSWLASLNLSKNAKRAAYAHISFNFIGVAVMLPLFFQAMILLRWALGFFGGDPSVPVIVDGEETFPLVPVAVGLYSTAFNIFNVLLLFPFVGVFERILSRVGRNASEVSEDFSRPRFLDEGLTQDLARAVPAVEAETRRHLEAGALFLGIARGDSAAPSDPEEHYVAVDILNRDIRRFSADLFHDGMGLDQADLVGSLIEEADFTASLAESLHQVARRVRREEFSAGAKGIVEEGLVRLDAALDGILPPPHPGVARAVLPAGHVPVEPIEVLRGRVLTAGGVTPGERGAILAILGSIERAELLIERIDAERRSVNRAGILARARAAEAARRLDDVGGFAPVPAE